MFRLPIFNIGEFENSTGDLREKFCTDLDKFCSEIGFLLIENHGVPDNVIESQWTAVNQFFSQKIEDKKKERAQKIINRYIMNYFIWPKYLKRFYSPPNGKGYLLLINKYKK